MARPKRLTARTPALAPFLALLDKRLQARPERIVPYDKADAADDRALVRGVKLV